MSEQQLVEALEACIEAIDNEWLYQTGQFSRRETPPSNYPTQGSVHGDLHEARGKARDAIKAAATTKEG